MASSKAHTASYQNMFVTINKTKELEIDLRLKQNAISAADPLNQNITTPKGLISQNKLNKRSLPFTSHSNFNRIREPMTINQNYSVKAQEEVPIELQGKSATWSPPLSLRTP